MARQIPYNAKITLHLYHHERSGTIKLRRNHNETQGSIQTLGEGYTLEQAQAVASLLNCKVEVLKPNHWQNDNRYIPIERQDELALENSTESEN